MTTNYEAIGRCTKLEEKIRALSIARNGAINDLRQQLRHTMGVHTPRDVVYTFDSEKAYATMKSLEAANLELMEAVGEFNEYAADGERQPYKVIEPRES